MITYKISNQHIKRRPCDQREYSTDLFTGSLEGKIKERTDITTEKDHSHTNQMSSLDCSMAHHIVMGLMSLVGYIYIYIYIYEEFRCKSL